MSLLETLIALMIITGALLGIITLQSLALRQVHTAYYKNIAEAQAQALLERFRADPSPPGLAQEFNFANELIKNLLPQGQANYQCTAAAHPCTVSMFWEDHGRQSLTLSSLL